MTRGTGSGSSVHFRPFVVRYDFSMLSLNSRPIARATTSFSNRNSSRIANRLSFLTQYYLLLNFRSFYYQKVRMRTDFLSSFSRTSSMSTSNAWSNTFTQARLRSMRPTWPPAHSWRKP